MWVANDGQCVLLERVCVWYVLWCAGRAWRGVRWRALACGWIFRHVLPTGNEMQQENCLPVSDQSRSRSRCVRAEWCRSDRRQRANRAPRVRCGFPFPSARSQHDPCTLASSSPLPLSHAHLRIALEVPAGGIERGGAHGEGQLAQLRLVILRLRGQRQVLHSELHFTAM